MKLKMKYPKAALFVAFCEFFEKLSSFGIKTVLSLYLMEILHFPENTAVIVLHTVGVLDNIFPLIGGIIADSWLGRYRMILYAGSLYVFGNLLLTASSTPWFHIPVREISLLGLFLLTLAAGCYKPCLTSFGSDQFKSSKDEDGSPSYVPLLYVLMASSSILSTFISPILRKDIFCFGFNSCYPLVFLYVSILSILAMVIFLVGTPWYKIMKPEGNVVLKVVKCIVSAIARSIRSPESRNHWLDHADAKYKCRVIDDTKAILSLLKLFIPLTMYWSVQVQQMTRWTFQATRMNGELFGYVIKPDQFHLAVSLMALTFIFILPYIYPIIGKFFFINTPLRKMTAGGMLVATSFLITGILEFKLESTYAKQPFTGLAQIRIVNTLNCPVSLTLENQIQELGALDIYQNLSIPVTGNTSLKYSFNIKCPPFEKSHVTGYIRAEEKKSLTYLLQNNSLHISFEDRIKKSMTGDPTIRALIFTDTGSPANLNLSIKGKNNYVISLTGNEFVTKFIEVIHDSYKVIIEGAEMESNVPLRSGGVYMIVGQISNGSKVIKIVTVVEPNSVHMLWQFPQFLPMAMGEIMFVLNGLDFALNQAPVSMKSVVLAAWSFATAVGNLIVVVITKAHFFERQMFEFFLFAGLLYADMLIFAVMAMSYKYVDNSSKENSVKNEINLPTIRNIENDSHSENL